MREERKKLEKSHSSVEQEITGIIKGMEAQIRELLGVPEKEKRYVLKKLGLVGY